MRIALVGAECEENLALRYIQAALEQAGHEVLHIPFNTAEDLEPAALALARSRAALAGVSMVFTYRAREFARLLARARERGYRGHLVAGGHFAAFHADALLRDVPALDSIAVGEGEGIMVDLAARLDRLPEVRGLVWRDAAGTPRHNPPADPVTDLDTLAPPARRTPPDAYLGLPIANVLSSRGCTHACAFCSIAAWHRHCGGPRFRQRPAARVAGELADLFRRGYRIFNFHDDNFLLRDRDGTRAWLEELARGLESAGVGRIAFAIKARPDSVDPEVFARLKEMGLFRVFVGIEAGTSESLRRPGRRQTVAQNERALEILAGLDLHVCFNLLLLNPDSTLEDVRGNLAFFRDHAAYPQNFCRTEIYAGTPLERRLRREGRLRGTYWGFDYTIRDPRAQRFFEGMHRVLFERHHAAENVHHQTMRLDYERQLLAHFHGCAPSLAARVRAFTTQVNLRTCAHLETLAGWAERDDAGTPAGRARLADLHARVQEEGAAEAVAGAHILWLIRQAAEGLPGQRRRESRAAPAAAAAAALMLATAAAQDGPFGMQFEEMAPVPGEMEEPPAQETPATESPLPPDAADAALIRAEFDRQVLPLLAQRVRPPADLAVELWLDEAGKVKQVEIHKGLVVAPAAPLSDADRARVPALLKQLGAERFKDREQATAELKKLGRAVAPLVKQAIETTDDPEVQVRGRRILDALGEPLVFPGRDDVLAALRQMAFSAEAARGKHFVIPVRAQRLRRPFIETHIFEMAPEPAPRD